MRQPDKRERERESELVVSCSDGWSSIPFVNTLKAHNTHKSGVTATKHQNP